MRSRIVLFMIGAGLGLACVGVVGFLGFLLRFGEVETKDTPKVLTAFEANPFGNPYANVPVFKSCPKPLSLVYVKDWNGTTRAICVRLAE